MTDNSSHSFQGDQKALTEEDDRREAQRTTALFRPALVEIGELSTFCLVRNISSSGLMATLHVTVARGQPVIVRFDERHELKGNVVWQKDDRVGFEFVHAIDVADLFVSLSGTKGDNPSYRSPRLKIEASANWIVHGTLHTLEIKDISQRGLKAAASFIKAGDEGTILIPGLSPRKAVARWNNDGIAGFLFIDPIGFTELGQWVLTHADSEKRKLVN